VPKNSGEKMYLGLSRDDSFKIHQIKAKVVLIKIFNLYCPVCRPCPMMNRTKDSPKGATPFTLIRY
jgi:hypothetical protein